MCTPFVKVFSGLCLVGGNINQPSLHPLHPLHRSHTDKLGMSGSEETSGYPVVPIKSIVAYRNLRDPDPKTVGVGFLNRLESVGLGRAEKAGLMQSLDDHQEMDGGRDTRVKALVEDLAEALASVAPHRMKIAQNLDHKLGSRLENLGIRREAWLHTLKHWCAPHRHYHSITHLETLINRVLSLESKDYSESEKNDLILFAIFHDAFYHPKCTINEEKSVEMYVNALQQMEDYSSDVVACIWVTKSHRPPANTPENKLISTAWKLDNYVVGPGSLKEKLDWEKGVKREFLPFFSHAEYRAGRGDFLKGRLEDPETLFSNEQDKENLRSIYQSVLEDKIKIGLFVGSFNPISNGHKRIIDRVEASDDLDIDILALGIGQNQEKNTSGNPDSVKERVGNKVFHYGKSIIPLMEELSEDSVTILRGLRGAEDILEEIKNIEFLNKNGLVDLKMKFIKGDAEFKNMSSTRIRKLLEDGKIKEAEALQPPRLSALKALPPTSYSSVLREISCPILLVSGGVGAGKSRVCKLIQENIQKDEVASYFSMDKLYNEVFSPGKKLTKALIQFMGVEFGTPEAGINWNKLRSRVMESEPERKRLEFFTHPIINRALSEALEALINNESADAIDYLVIEHPFFFDTQFPHELTQHPQTKTIYIDVDVKDDQQRIERVIQRSGGALAKKDVEAIMKHQADPKVCRELADYVLKNDDFSKLHQETQRVISSVRSA